MRHDSAATITLMIVDIVDEQNRVVGTADRRDVLAKQLNFRTVHVLLLDDQNRCALQLLPMQHPRNPGRLGSSVAGYLNHGETYAQAAARKCIAEVGLRPDLTDLGTLPTRDVDSKKFVRVYVGRLNGQPKIDREQIDQLVYLTASEIAAQLDRWPERFTPTFREVFRYYSAARHEG